MAAGRIATLIGADGIRKMGDKTKAERAQPVQYEGLTIDRMRAQFGTAIAVYCPKFGRLQSHRQFMRDMLDNSESARHIADEQWPTRAPYFIIATNRATYNELPVCNGKPALKPMQQADRLITAQQADDTLRALDAQYGARWSFSLASALIFA